MKIKKFETLWKLAKQYESFDINDYVSVYNCFIWAVEEHATNVFGEEFNYEKFRDFVLCWRWTAKQEQSNKQKTPKQLCNDVYGSYFETPAP